VLVIRRPPATDRLDPGRRGRAHSRTGRGCAGFDIEQITELPARARIVLQSVEQSAPTTMASSTVTTISPTAFPVAGHARAADVRMGAVRAEAGVWMPNRL